MENIKPVKEVDKPFAGCDGCSRGGEWEIKEGTFCSSCIEKYGWWIDADNTPHVIISEINGMYMVG